jgi:hypothetical protein
LHSSTDDVVTTAAGWHRDAPTANEYEERMDRWLDYYRREGIEAVSYGAIVLRRRTSSGPNWVRSTRLPSGRVGPADTHLRRLFAAQDTLTGASDEDVLELRPAVADEAALEQELVRDQERWTIRSLTLALEAGLGFRAGLDATTGEIVRRLDGTRTVREVLAETASAVDVAPGDLERAGLALTRQLLELGFVVPFAD